MEKKKSYEKRFKKKRSFETVNSDNLYCNKRKMFVFVGVRERLIVYLTMSHVEF